MTLYLAAFCEIPTLPHGRIANSWYCSDGECVAGGSVIFACDSGHRLSGPAEVYCFGHGNYTPSIPTCEQGTVILLKHQLSNQSSF